MSVRFGRFAVTLWQTKLKQFDYETIYTTSPLAVVVLAPLRQMESHICLDDMACLRVHQHCRRILYVRMLHNT
jgi:hypothetical protein